MTMGSPQGLRRFDSFRFSFGDGWAEDCPGGETRCPGWLARLTRAHHPFIEVNTWDAPH